jgi:hydrogenase nickel incorporation protein HypA/HybF
MHELSIAMSILDLAAEEAQRRGARGVAAIHLKMGPLSGVVKEALLAAYDLAREASTINAAELIIDEVPLVVNCSICQTERTLTSPQELFCPACGTPTPDVVHGRELEVFALELET